MKNPMPGGALKESQEGLALVGRVPRADRLGLVKMPHENVTVFLMGDCGSMSGRGQPGKWKPLKVFRGPKGLLEENRDVGREGPSGNAQVWGSQGMVSPTFSAAGRTQVGKPWKVTGKRNVTGG